MGGTNWTNSGTIEATNGGYVVSSGTWTDDGLMSVDSTSLINLQGTFSVDSGSSFAGAGDVYLEGTLDNTGETLTLNDPEFSFAVVGGTIDGGTVETTDGAALVASLAGGTLDGVTIDGTLDVNNGGHSITVTDGLTLNGTLYLGPADPANGTSTLDFQGAQTLGGTGLIVLGGDGSYPERINTVSSGGDSGTLTIGPNITIDGTAASIGYDSGPGTETPLVLEGTIDANSSASYIQIFGTNWTNSGTIEATAAGAQLGLSGTNWTNSGTIEATGGGYVTASGTWTDNGVISADSTSQVNLEGTFSVGSDSSFAGSGLIDLAGTLDNTGEILTLNDPTLAFTLDAGTIDGGTVETTGGAALVGDGALDGVTIDGTLDENENGDTITVTDGLTLNGTLDLGPIDPANGSSTLDFQGAQTLGGTGLIVLGGAGYEPEEINTASSGGDSGTLTIGPNITIDGTAAFIGYNGGGTETPLVLEGTIDASTSASYIQIIGTSWTNTGTIETTDGGQLVLNGTNWTNSGTIAATNGGFAVVEGTWSDDGVVSGGAGASVYLLGTGSTLPGSSFAGAGDVFLNGTLDNNGDTLSLDDPALEFALDGGTIDGGTVETTNGATLVGGAGTLDGVTIDGTVDMTTIGDTITVTQGLTLNGTIDLGPTDASGISELNFQGAQTLSGTGSIVFGNFYEGDQINTASSGGDSGALTIGPNITVQGTDGVIGYDHGGPETPIVLEGTIDANTSGGSVQIYGTDWTSSGTIAATNGGTINLETAPSNFTPGLLTGGTWSVGADSTLNFPGGNIATDAATIILDGPGASFPALSSLAYIAPGGTLELSDGASFTTTTSLLNQGTINVADPGILNIEGNFTLAAGGQLDVGVGGYSPGSGFSQLNVTGQLTLGGALDVTLLGGFTPVLGNSFPIINYGSVTGAFSSESGLEISSSLNFRPVTNPTQFDLDVIESYIVTTTADMGDGSLRAAIEAADLSSGPFAIDFDIPGGGVQLISPLSPLPFITAVVDLDATTQPGYAGAPIIQLDGTSTGSASGLVLAAGSAGSEISGVVISDFSQDGILIESSGNVVQSSYIGTNASGTAAAPNQIGIVIGAGASGNTIGGTSAPAGNVISGNASYGVQITGSGATGNVVEGNMIGTDPSGTVAIANATGVEIASGASSNTIGGTAAGDGNLISGNLGDGVLLNGAATADNVVAGNQIGTDTTGETPLGNAGAGVDVAGATDSTIGGVSGGGRNVLSGNAEGVSVSGGATGTLIAGNLIGTDANGISAVGNTNSGIAVTGALNTTIGGTTAVALNVISGNGGLNNGINGIEVEGGASGTLIQGNYIGVNQDGTGPLANTGSGIVDIASPGTTIGGTAEGAGNVISANAYVGVSIQGSASSGALVLGNYIGTDKTGKIALGNLGDGLELGDVSDVTIGGTAAGVGNVISSNSGAGIDLVGSDSGVLIQANKIGTDPTGSVALGNGTGILIQYGSSDNTIGGSAAAAGNTIAFSTGTSLHTGLGVDVDASAGTGNTIRLNSIFSNHGLGIGLGGNVVTPISATPLTGPNNYENYPVITAVTSTGGMTTVMGSLESTANTTFMLDFYTLSSSNASGYGEGRYVLGSGPVPIDASGTAHFTFSFPTPATGVQFVTATATDPAGNTSEFSQAFGSDIPPTAKISFTKLTVDEGVSIPFNGSGSIDPNNGSLSYFWTFGDGATGTGPDPIHAYTKPGVETVTLTVDDGFGGVSTATATVTVSDVPPVFTPDSFTPPETFSSSTSGDGFGTAVAAIDGNVVIGAPQAGNGGAVDLYDGVPTDDGVSTPYRYGSLIHVFQDPGATAGDLFGASVADFGDDLIVGRPARARAWRMCSMRTRIAPRSARCS